MTVVAVDTSVAVPLVLAGHEHHDAVLSELGDRVARLAGHSALETYSVLTRLPVDDRLTAGDARTVIDDAFDGIAELSAPTSEIVDQVAAAGIVGGAVYDALVALASMEHLLTLVTRDERALPAYAALGAQVELISP